MLQGLSSGIISYFRGISFRAGFYSGLGSAFDVGTEKYGGMVGRTSIMAIIGGTFAKLGGGKFANGAFTSSISPDMELPPVLNAKKNPKKST